MKIVKVEISHNTVETSMDINQEYTILKKLYSILGKELHLKDICKCTFRRYESYIHLFSNVLHIDQKIDNDSLLADFGLFPSQFTDFLYFNGAEPEVSSYRPTGGMPHKQKSEGKKKWLMINGFWKEVEA
jgi:hypothetical protein